MFLIIVLIIVSPVRVLRTLVFFFFNDTATTEIYTLSLHDALPIFELLPSAPVQRDPGRFFWRKFLGFARESQDRKSTRLNSSHQIISYAVFCLKKKKTHMGVALRMRSPWTLARSARSAQLQSAHHV